jgi:ABC-type transport system involved in multi-copper enzyme maturation permease subunit
VPIHDQSYRRYGGERELAGRAWLVIARNGIETMARKRIFFALLLASWAPLVGWALWLYFNANYAAVAALPMLQVTAGRFRTFLEWQNPFLFVITVWVGAGLIANDKRANALQIYLSKPLGRSEYIAGKALILVTFLLLVTWIPSLVLLILQIAFSGSFAFMRQNLYLFPAVTVLSFLSTLLAAFAMLALSALTKSARYAAVVFAGISFLTDAIYGIVYASTGSSVLSWISIPANLRQVGDVIFRITPRYDTPWVISLLAILVVIGASLWVLERRVRGVEVVS